MAKLIKIVGGKKVYHGILSKNEIIEADKIQEYLENEIPNIENELNKKYKTKDNMYAYEFGKRFKDLAERFNVKQHEMQVFLQQIRDFAAKDENIPKDRTDKRKTYLYYFKLSQYSINAVKNMNWGEWVYLFDVREARRDERIIDWFAYRLKTTKIKRDHFRLFMTGIRIFARDKDLAVYNDEQLFAKFDMVYDVTENWFGYYFTYFKKVGKVPTESRVKKKKKFQEKYFIEIFSAIKEYEGKKLDEICEQVFKKMYLLKLYKRL